MPNLHDHTFTEEILEMNVIAALIPKLLLFPCYYQLLIPILTIKHHPLHILFQCWQRPDTRLSYRPSALSGGMTTAIGRSILLHVWFHVETGAESS